MPFKNVDTTGLERVGIVGSGIFRSNAGRVVFIARDTSQGKIEMVTQAIGNASGERSFIYSLPAGELAVPEGSTFQIAQLGDAGEFRWQEITESTPAGFANVYQIGSALAGATMSVQIDAVPGLRFYLCGFRAWVEGAVPTVAIDLAIGFQGGSMRFTLPPNSDALKGIEHTFAVPYQFAVDVAPAVVGTGGPVPPMKLPAFGTGRCYAELIGYFQ